MDMNIVDVPRPGASVCIAIPPPPAGRPSETAKRKTKGEKRKQGRASSGQAGDAGNAGEAGEAGEAAETPRPGTSTNENAGEQEEATCEVTVLEPPSRNREGSTRSLLYQFGFLFKPEVSGGEKFMCLLPIKDKRTGETRPCNTLLKIPQGSLGNPFRHLKRLHREAYNAAMAKPGVKKGVIFCAIHLLPFKSDSLRLKKLPDVGVLVWTLKLIQQELLQKGQDRVSKSREFYGQVPFLKVVVHPGFVPRPLVSVSFINGEGGLEVINLLADSDSSCATLGALHSGCFESACDDDSFFNQSLVPAVHKVFEAYGFHGIGNSVASIGCESDFGYCTSYVPAKYQKSAEKLHYVERYLNPSLELSSSCLAGVRESLMEMHLQDKREAGQAVDPQSLEVAKEFSGFERARTEWKEGVGNDVSAFWTRFGLGSREQEALPILFKYASSFQVAHPALQTLQELQDQRDAEHIQSNTFLPESFRSNPESKESQEVANAILHIKYNVDLAISQSDAAQELP